MVDALADLRTGLWARLRSLILFFDRLDRLEDASEFVGWRDELLADGGHLAKSTRSFTLRVLHLASDPANDAILAVLVHGGPQRLKPLLNAARLDRVELAERLNELSRAGLVAQPLDSTEISATILGRGFVTLVDTLSSHLDSQARQNFLGRDSSARPAMSSRSEPHGNSESL